MSLTEVKKIRGSKENLTRKIVLLSVVCHFSEKIHQAPSVVCHRRECGRFFFLGHCFSFIGGSDRKHRLVGIGNIVVVLS